ncbi:MAG: SHOCT domain-containing protein [Protaetiibacter sp.]
MNLFGAGFVVFFGLVVLFIVAVVVVMIVMISRNAAKARQLGHDPLTMQTELAARAMDSGLLAPQKSLEARLAELDELRARGVISAEEHAKARADTLSGS